MASIRLYTTWFPLPLWFISLAAAAKSFQLWPTLCNLKDCSPPGSSVHGISQERTLEWVTMPSSRGISPTQGSNPPLLHSRQILYRWATREAHFTCYCPSDSARHLDLNAGSGVFQGCTSFKVFLLADPSAWSFPKYPSRSLLKNHFGRAFTVLPPPYLHSKMYTCSYLLLALPIPLYVLYFSPQYLSSSSNY